MIKQLFKSNNKNAAAAQFERMTKTPVNKLIVSLSVPTVISMLITNIYNAADTYFVSKIDVAASGATGVVFSLMAILQAFGFMFGHGGGSCISRHLGSKDVEKARRYSSTAFFLALLAGVMIMIPGLLFLTPFMRFLGSTDTILPYARDYGFYILLSAPAMTASCVVNNILRYEGMAALAMVGLTCGGVLNMILDPIFIFPLGMGIGGAGLATAISQYVSLSVLLVMYYRGAAQSKMHIKWITLKPKFVWEIVSTGLPSLARQGLNSVSSMVLNIEAVPFGDACIAAMSIVSKISNLLFSICIGIGQGFQPVSSFNYGAGRYSRVKGGIKFTWGFSTAVITVLSLFCFMAAPQLVTMFRHEAEVLAIGTAALRMLCVSLIALPTVMISNMTFQSIGKTGRAFFLALTQNGLFFIPLVMILPDYMGVTGIEVAQPIAYVIAAIVTVPFILPFMKALPEDKITKEKTPAPKG